MGSLRVRRNWATSLSIFTFMHWRRKWQPTHVLAWRIPGTGESGGMPSMGLHSQTWLKRLSSSSSFLNMNFMKWSAPKHFSHLLVYLNSFKYSTSHFTKVIPLIRSVGSQCENFQGTIPEGIARKFLVSKVKVLEEGDCNFITLVKLVRCFTLSPLFLPLLRIQKSEESCEYMVSWHLNA